MPKKVVTHEVTKIVAYIRGKLAGREFVNNQRFSFEMSSRSPAPPSIPDGPAHKLSDNYYCSRDVRRMVEPPYLIGNIKVLSSKENDPKKSGKKIDVKKGCILGPAYKWD